MKKLLVAFVICISCISATAQEIDPRIQEIYLDKTQEMVGDDQARLNFLTNLLQNRVEIVELADSKEKYKKLSELALLNKYNPALQRDVIFNPATFNPLKYDMEFSTMKEAVIYSVDNTNYIIIIHPQTFKK